ncbi:hypothetical protein [Streptomyces cellulosae]|uniref:Orc1-like AAA ATPase domain-containing protein n=1 Tax=Streptomyces cellulosae TaxID=1968 RepID=A0ABW7Y6P4_STRCE
MATPDTGNLVGRPLQFFPIDIGAYQHHPPLPTGPEVDGVAALLTPFGAHTDPWDTPLHERGGDAVEERLRHWSTLPGVGGDTVLYWVGHGSSDGGFTTLLAHARSPHPLTSGGFTPQQLLHYLHERQGRRHAGWAIIVIDACTSGRFVELMSAYAHLNPGARNFLLISTSKDGSTTLGAFREALATVLTVTFRGQDTIDLRDLANELNRNLHGSPAIAHTDTGRAFLYRTWPTLAGTLHVPLDLIAEIETVLSTLTVDERRHFIPKASGAELGEQAWYFEGRGSERHTVLSWLHTIDRGMLVVTGTAGCGKSALLGHILVHTRPELQAILIRAGQLAPLPASTPHPGPPIDAALHLTGATPQDVMARIADTAGLGVPPATEPMTSQTAWLIGQLQQRRRRPRSLTLLIDALDEAHQPLIIADQILRPLAATPGIRLIVGTRRSTQEGPDLPASADQDLLDALGLSRTQPQQHTTLLRLQRDNQAMTRYIHRRLTAAATRGDLPSDPRHLAETAAALGGLNREFLYARLAVHEIIHTPALAVDPGPLLHSDHRHLFARAVDRLAAQAPANRSLLQALALAQGRGLPLRDGIWATAATALAPAPDAPVTDADIAQLTDTAAPYLMLDTESGQSVYRLSHRTFAEHFTSAAPASGHDERHQRITEHLASHADGRLPATSPNPYLVHHLPTHAALAGPPGWQTLADHPLLLDRLNPTAVTISVMLNAFGRIDLPPAIAGVVAAHPFLAAASPADRPGLRQLATTRYTDQTIPAPPAHTPQDPHATWSVRWAHLKRHPLHLPLTGDTGGAVGAVAAFTGPDDRTLLATGSRDGSVRVWDLATAQPVGEPMRGHPSGVGAMVTFTGPDGRTLLATGSRDGSVRVWDPATGRLVGEPMRGHSGGVGAMVAFTGPDGRTLLATGSWGGSVRVWDPATGRLVGEPMGGHSGGVAAFTGPDGRTLLATGSRDGSVRVWDPATGRLVGEPMRGHSGGAWAVVAYTGPDGHTLIAASSRDGSLRVWDPATGRLAGRLMRGHPSEVGAMVAFTGTHGHTLIAASSSDGVVRVWDPTTGRLAGRPMRGHPGEAVAVAAFTGPDGRTLIAAGGSDGVVRVWDPTTEQTVGKPMHGYTRAVWALAAFNGSDGRTLLATGSNDGVVRVWDPATAQPAGKPMHGHTGLVGALAAFNGSDGRTLLATGGSDGVVRVWDPATAQTVGKPMPRHPGGVGAVAAFTGPKGRTLLATGGWDGMVRVWDPTTAQPAGEPIRGHSGDARAVAAFTGPKGRTLLATGGSDGVVRVWDPATAQPAGGPIRAHSDGVGAVAAFTGPKGRTLLATGGSDGMVRMWDPGTGAAHLTIPLGIEVRGITAAGTDLALATAEGVLMIRLEPGSGR